jgi:hypothetical protein
MDRAVVKSTTYAVYLGALCLFGASLVWAEDGLQPSSPAAATPEPPSFHPWRFRFGVRGFVTTSSTSSEGMREEEVDLTFLRPEIRWDPSDGVRALVEAELSDGPHLTDAFVRLRSARVGVRAGQFKPPFSSLEMASRWDIPTANRGVLTEVLVDSMGWAGRRPGIEGQLRGRGRWDMDLRIGLFQASHTRGDRIGDEGFDNPSDGFSFDSQAIFARVELSRKRGSLGLSGEWRPAEPVPGEGSSRYWAANVDFTWTARRKAGGLRAWVEGYCGSSWQDSNAFDELDTTFVAGRTVLAWRFGGERKGKLFFEPYARTSVVDPDAKVTDDLVSELGGGLNAGLFDRLRFNLEVEHERYAPNVPLSLGLEPLGAPSPESRTTLFFQVGGAF